jgi:hypothetical protein
VTKRPARGTPRPTTRRAAAVAVLVLCSFLGSTLAACTSARDTLGTNASQCFEALAIASDAVHDRGTFAGVRLLSAAVLTADVHLRADLSAIAGSPVHDLCVVSYRGTFRSHQVERPLGSPVAGGVGHYAIVIVSKPQNHLIGTVVRVTQPLRFGHPV